MDYPCIKCRKEVRLRQHAIACELCGILQHRTCDTGRHRRLNQRAGDSPPFYVLTKVLIREVEDSENSVRLVSELSLRQLQRQKYRSMQSRVFAAWDSYRDGGMSASALLKKMSTIYKPRLTTTVENEEE